MIYDFNPLPCTLLTLFQDEEARLEVQSRAQMLSRNVWDLLMLLPTNPDLLKKFKALTPQVGCVY